MLKYDVECYWWCPLRYRWLSHAKRKTSVNVGRFLQKKKKWKKNKEK